jgi:tRNA dimethylallyltransferase
LERLCGHSEALPKIEVVSADSMQVYRGMDIGTAKPSPALQKKLPHHLIDIRDPDEQFNAGDFVRLADEACAAVYARGAVPVVSGGTGFYLKNFIYGLSCAPPSGLYTREALKAELRERGADALVRELAALDPESAQKIHPNDSYRLLRALELCRVSGRARSAFPLREEPRAAYRFIIAGIKREREDLYRRVDRRCREMFAAGLAGEASALFKKGYTPDDAGMRAIGYREFFVRNEDDTAWRLSEDLEGVERLVARNSRRYVKRQLTFFLRMPGITWIDGDDVTALRGLLRSAAA